MASLVTNIAKGRLVFYYEFVKTNSPAASAIVVVPVSVGATTDDALQDFDTLAAVLAGGVTERTTNGWTRKTLTDADLGAVPSPDDTNNRMDLPTPQMVWTAVASGGGATTHLLYCYDPDTGAGTDSNIIPLCFNDFAITPDGSDVQANAGNFFRAEN
jgi:hypothetical protein